MSVYNKAPLAAKQGDNS